MNSDSETPMDNQLLQLERELFSLSPVETPRHLASRLDRQVMAPVCIGRQVAVTAKITPFPWRRMVVPAAAAVVVVSVLNHLDTPTSRAAGTAQSKSGFRSQAPGLPTASQGTGYVLRTEPVMISPGTWRAMEQQYYYIQPGAGVGTRSYNIPQRQSGVAPVVFH